MKNGGFVLLVLLIAGVCLSTCSRQQRSSIGNQQENAKPFKSGHEFIFDYNAQLSSGLMIGEEKFSQQQTAATRVHSKAHITFQSKHEATLHLKNIRIGYLNEELEQPQQVQPMGRFELKRLHEEKQKELELPVEFKYVDGVVESIQFHHDDPTWSRNMKRSVLNMIQLNLKKNNVQQLREQSEESSEEDQEQKIGYKAYTIPEITIEGNCQTIYTINQVKENFKQQSEFSTLFNVTKSVNFKQCSKVADVSYGFQTQEVQTKWAQCQQQWEKMQGRDQSQQRPLSAPCDQYDPKEVREQKLDRSTVLRFQLAGKRQEYAIQHVELISHYVFKNLKAENSKYGSAMHTFVAAELTFDESKPVERHNSPKYSGRKETLLYSNAWNVEEKRFYMFGDEVYQRNSPFKAITGKVEQAQQILRRLVQATTDKNAGIEGEVTIQLERLVELLRMFNMEELKTFFNQITSTLSSRSEVEKHRVEHLIADSLAIAGTRNTIKFLVDKLINNELSTSKGVQALKNLNQLPAPSHQQTDLVLRLCKSELTHRSEALKQSCWLTFGSMVAELCQQASWNGTRQVFGFQSGFEIEEEICPENKKRQYQETLEKQYTEATNTAERVLLLRAIGNAGMENMINLLKETIVDRNQQTIVRISAIDGLRRLRNRMPRKIQRILLPIFQNVREQPEIRMVSFAMIMRTTPEQNVIDQITFTLNKDSSEQVKSFVYTMMQSMSRSKLVGQQELAQHLKNALKSANIDEQNLTGSYQYEFPIFSDEQREGALIDLMSVFSDREMLPTHLKASIHTILNDEFELDTLRVSVSQQELARWYEKIVRQFHKMGSDSSSNIKTRGERKSSSSRRGDEEIQRIYKALGIKKREFSSVEKQESFAQNEEFAVLQVRIGDVDQVIWPISKETAPQFLREIIKGEKPSLKNLISSIEQLKNTRFVVAMNLNKKSAVIATSVGVALRISQAAPIIATLEGEIINESDKSLGLKARINVHSVVSATHIQKMESWMPIVNTGVESYRSLEANLPIHMELKLKREDGFELAIKTPQAPKTTLFGIHTLPTTFTRDYDNKNKIHREQKVKAIHHYHLEEFQRDVEQTVGEQTLGLPIRIHGHYHTVSDVTDYKQLVQLIMATENHVHVTFEPRQNTPTEIVFRLNANIFQNVHSSTHTPEIREFYNNAGNFESAYPEDLQDMQLENHKERSDKLQKYIAKYQQTVGPMYKHEIVASVQTVGGNKQFKAEMKIEGTSDAKLKYCKLSTEMERTPIFEGESSNWALRSKIQLVTPEIFNTVQELQEQSEKNKKLICWIETTWGTDRQQKINLRIQGEQAHKREWRQQIEQRGISERNSEQKRIAFLNKYDVVADYKIESSTQNMFNNLIALIKTYNFWGLESQQNFNGRTGHFVGMVVIDPLTQKHVNLTLKTPSQKVRVQSMRLPIQIRPFALVSRKPEQSINSITQVLSRWSTEGRAECKVDGKAVETFDEVVYKAPISTCYSVLAKDCNGENPRFVVLMKKLNKNTQDKKIRILTQENVIECQPTETNNGKKIQCQLNGENVEQTSFDSIVDFINEEQNAVLINVEGVSVLFRCQYNSCESQEAIVKLSNLFKNQQCGLCGHYDDNAEDEWRMNNDETSEDLMQFHRSYSLKDAECDNKEHDEFYGEQNRKDFSVESDRQIENSNEWNRLSSSEEEQIWEQGQTRFNNQQIAEQTQPILRTKVIEYNHEICFSKAPLKECPEGTIASDKQWKSDEDDQSENNTVPKTRTAFACFKRSSSEARKLRNEVRRNVNLNLDKHTTKFVQQIEQPTQCIRAY